MSIKPDHWIEQMAREWGMIYPFIGRQVSGGVISYGLGSYGYDVRTTDDFKIFTNINTIVIDPKNFNQNSFIEFKGDVCTIPPNSFALTSTIEKIHVPPDTTVLVTNKSTLARCGIVTPCTVLEAGWIGHITIEISNTSPLPARIYAGEGIAQLLFFQAAQRCNVSYRDRKGKYQNQTDITLPKVGE